MMKRLRSLAIGGLAALALSGCGDKYDPTAIYSDMHIDSLWYHNGLRLWDVDGNGTVDFVSSENKEDSSKQMAILKSDDYETLNTKQEFKPQDELKYTPVMTPQLRDTLTDFYRIERKAAHELDKFLGSKINGGALKCD